MKLPDNFFISDKAGVYDSFRTHSTIPFGWLIKLGTDSFFVANNFSDKVSDIDDDDDGDGTIDRSSAAAFFVDFLFLLLKLTGVSSLALRLVAA